MGSRALSLSPHVGDVAEEMPDEPQRSARYLREKAEEIRRCAWHVRSALVRFELFKIAEGFERMAARAENRRVSAPNQSEREWAASPPPHTPAETGEQPCKSAT